MVLGFHDAEEFAPIIGWELYQVTLDKYHVMFWFENGLQLLNIAHAFSHTSQDHLVSYMYEIHGDNKRIEIDRMLREKVVDVVVRSPRRLAIIFRNGDELIVHDDPNAQSWWFTPVQNPADPEWASQWGMSDIDPE